MHAVGEGFFRLMVDFDEEAIGTDGDSGAGERENFVALAGAVTGVDEDGEVAAFFDRGNNGEVESVAGKIGEGADATFAEHDVVVAFGEDIFGGHEEFVEGGRHAAFEENGELGAPGAFEEGEILHAAGANLDDVGVLLDEVERFVVDGFGDNAEAEAFADLREDFQAGEAEALEGVRRGAWLVGASAEEMNAGGLEALGDGEALVRSFDGTGTGNQGDVRAADEDVAGRSGNANDGVFFLDVAGDKLVGLGDGDALNDAGHGFEDPEIDFAGIAGDTDGGAASAGDGMGFKAERFDAVANVANLFVGGMRLHDNQHRCFLVWREFSVYFRGGEGANEVGGEENCKLKGRKGITTEVAEEP